MAQEWFETAHTEMHISLYSKGERERVVLCSLNLRNAHRKDVQCKRKNI